MGEVGVQRWFQNRRMYVSSKFLGDSEEGFHLLRAYTKRVLGQPVLKFKVHAMGNIKQRPN
jgi:hypothetical protein